MARHTVIFQISSPSASRIYEALSPELHDDPNTRSLTRTICDGNTLILILESEQLSALRATLMTLMRLVSVADEMHELVMKRRVVLP